MKLEIGGREMESIINIRDANGEVITVMDGRFTLGQVIMAALAFIVLIMAFHITKKALHTAFVGCLLAVMLFYVGKATPEQIQGVADQIKAQGTKAYEAIVEKSDNLKIEDGSICIKLGDDWHDISEITSFVKGSDGSITISLGKQKFVLNDNMVGGLLEAFTKGK